MDMDRPKEQARQVGFGNDINNALNYPSNLPIQYKTKAATGMEHRKV